MTLRKNKLQPIVQAVAMDNAPPRIIKDVVKHFKDSIGSMDIFGKYPIDAAVHCGLSWDDGMKEIAEAFASAQQTKAINVCTRHGVKWENGMRNVLEGCNIDADIEQKDNSTGLFPFMVAAVGGTSRIYDLDSVFHLIKTRPSLVKEGL